MNVVARGVIFGNDMWFVRSFVAAFDMNIQDAFIPYSYLYVQSLRYLHSLRI